MSRGDYLAPAVAREAARRLSAGIRAALDVPPGGSPSPADPELEDRLLALGAWGDRCWHAEALPDALRADVAWDWNLSRARRAARWACALAEEGAEESARRALSELTYLVPGCDDDCRACEPVGLAMGLTGNCDGCVDLDEAFRGPLLRASRSPLTEAIRATRWPDVGVTGPGPWGTRDGLRWVRLAAGVVSAGGGFAAGHLVDTPARAREVMAETSRWWRPSWAPR